MNTMDLVLSSSKPISDDLPLEDAKLKWQVTAQFRFLAGS